MEYFALTYSIALVIVMAVCLEAGRRFAVQREKVKSEAEAGKKIVEGAFLGLLSLLIAFAFSGAISRFDHRRDLVIEEANDIGTAYLRVDLLSPETQPQMRELFRNYVDARLGIYRALPVLDAAKNELHRSEEIQQQIWTLAVTSTSSPESVHPDAGKHVLPALNTMIDISNSRTWAAQMHPPVIIYGLLFVVAVIASFIAGASLASGTSRAWIHIIGFVLLVGCSVFVTIELEYPRIGFINIEKYDQALVDVREGMK